MFIKNITKIKLRRWQSILNRNVRHLFFEPAAQGEEQPARTVCRGFIKVFNRRETEFDTRAKNWRDEEFSLEGESQKY